MVNVAEMRELTARAQEAKRKELSEKISRFVDEEIAPEIDYAARWGRSSVAIEMSIEDFEEKLNPKIQYRYRKYDTEDLIPKVEQEVKNYGFECSSYKFNLGSKEEPRLYLHFEVKW